MKVFQVKLTIHDSGIDVKEEKNGCLGIKGQESLNKTVLGKWFKRIEMGTTSSRIKLFLLGMKWLRHPAVDIQV